MGNWAMRTAFISLATLTLLVGPLVAQENRPWAEKLFRDAGTDPSHDFKSVAHGAQLFHRFTCKNLYKVPLEVSISRISCTCLTAVPSVKVIPPNETAYVDVTMNARLFKGARNVSIHVQFTHPQYFSTAELKVSAFSRTDVVFNPGQVHFGVVPQGQGGRQEIEVDYAGTLDWTITEIVTNGMPVTVVSEKKKSVMPGQVGYKLAVSLKPETPSGSLRGEIYLRTNDPASPLVPVLVEANVQGTLTVAPSGLRATLKVNEEMTAHIAIRGKKDFKVLGVEGQGEGVSVESALPSASALTHRLTIRIRPTTAGDLRKTLLIKTDAQSAPVPVTVECNATP